MKAPAQERRSKHSKQFAGIYVTRDGERVVIPFTVPLWLSHTKRRPWTVRAERRAANRRARQARRRNRP